MLRKPNETLRFSFWFEDTAGAGVALSPLPTVKVYDPSGSLIVNGSNCSASGPTGGYHYDHAYSGTPHMAGRWMGVATTSQTVAAKDRPSIIDVNVAGVGFLDASISGIAAAVVSAWLAAAKGVPVVGSWMEWIAGKLGYLTATPPTASEIATASATANWADASAPVRKLTGIGSLTDAQAGAAIAAAGGASDPLLNTAGTYDDGTVGAQIDEIARRITAGPVRIVSPGPDDNGTLEIIVGDAYSSTHSTRLRIPIPSAPDQTGAVQTFTVDGVTFSPAVTGTVSGTGTARVVDFELTAAQTALLSVLPSGVPLAGSEKYWRVVSTWATDSPSKPVTIAYGDARRPAWDRR